MGREQVVVGRWRFVVVGWAGAGRGGKHMQAASGEAIVSVVMAMPATVACWCVRARGQQQEEAAREALLVWCGVEGSWQHGNLWAQRRQRQSHTTASLARMSRDMDRRRASVRRSTVGALHPGARAAADPAHCQVFGGWCCSRQLGRRGLCGGLCERSVVQWHAPGCSCSCSGLAALPRAFCCPGGPAPTANMADNLTSARFENARAWLAFAPENPLRWPRSSAGYRL